MLLSVATVLTGLQVDFVRVDTYERSKRTLLCFILTPDPSHCCHSTSVSRAVGGYVDFLYSPQALELPYISSYLVFCCLADDVHVR